MAARERASRGIQTPADPGTRRRRGPRLFARPLVQSRAMISGSGPPRIKLSRREIALAFLLFTALTVLFAYPLSLHPATLRFPTGPDGVLGWYLLGWDTHA